MQHPPSPVPGQVEVIHPLPRILIGPHRLSYLSSQQSRFTVRSRGSRLSPGLAQPWEMNGSSPSTRHFITERELSELGVCFPHYVTEAPLSPLEERKEITQPSPSTLGVGCFYKCSTGAFPVPCIHLYSTFPEAPPACPSSGAAGLRRWFRPSYTRSHLRVIPFTCASLLPGAPH